VFLPSSDKKLRVAVLFGGRSAEHEVSLTSALSIIQRINQEKYQVVAVKISREGQWKVLPDVRSLDSVRALETAAGQTVLVGDPEAKGLVRTEGREPDQRNEFVDVVFPVLHGTYGEDGTIQGLFQLAGIPCVGGGVLASAVGMDKVVQKQVFLQHGLPMADFIWFLRREWEASPGPVRERIRNEIGFPCFIKPANLGSSVGIFKIKDESALEGSISKAAQYDRKLVVERAVDARELECAVLGNDAPEASVVGEIIPCNEFYDYEAKYLLDGSRTVVPADVPQDVSDSVRSMALSAFKAVDCAGMARIDFFLERGTGRVLLNEINTIPGFTPISMYPKLWEASGIPYPELIDRLIGLALERHADIGRSRVRR
jgi:D-alanine-D-alanine ligase